MSTQNNGDPAPQMHNSDPAPKKSGGLWAVIGVVVVAIIGFGVKFGLKHVFKSGNESPSPSFLSGADTNLSGADTKSSPFGTEFDTDRMAQYRNGNDDGVVDASAAHQNCLRFFDAVDVLDCSLLGASVPESTKTACRRYPAEFNFIEGGVSPYRKISEWGLCDEGKIPNWTFGQIVKTAIDDISNMEDVKDFIKTVFSKQMLDSLDGELNRAVQNIKDGRAYYENLYEASESNKIIVGFLVFYYYASICMIGPANACHGYDAIADKTQLIRVFNKMRYVITHEYVKVADDYRHESVTIMHGKPLVNAVAYYYKNKEFPRDVSTLMTYSDFDCNDPALDAMLLRAMKTFEPEVSSVDQAQEECRQWTSIRVDLGNRSYDVKEENFVYSEYDFYSYVFLRNPQKFHIDADGTTFRIRSNGLDAQPGTADDDVMTLDANVFAAAD